MDVLRYRGEGCDAWPTTSGNAEEQRARVQGGSGAGRRRQEGHPVQAVHDRTGACWPRGAS